MKKLFTVLVIVLISGCMAEREFVIESDYSYRGKFKKYKTFAFMNRGDTINFNGLSDSQVREEIERRLVSQGYKITDKRPSMLIVYTVFGNNLKFSGFDQVDLEYWDSKYGLLAENEDRLSEIREAEYNMVEYELKEGTLLIDFIDGKTHSVIWQGYASGLFDDRTFFKKDIKYAVRSILNQYRLVALNSEEEYY